MTTTTTDTQYRIESRLPGGKWTFRRFTYSEGPLALVQTGIGWARKHSPEFEYRIVFRQVTRTETATPWEVPG